ncbi:MAG: SDR family NAD(P)-dependent oxidoreductase [Candidatus Omnitrophota bacterium]
MKSILVTGGAGFIGSHLVEELVKRGHKVKVFDNLTPQVHGKEAKIPEYLHKDAEVIVADVRDRQALKKAIKGAEIIFHQAAAVGVGQSMYEISYYTEVNALGTANLLDIIVNEKQDIEKMIVASSMSIYGEGKYSCNDCGIVFPKLRSAEQLSRHQWEMKCPNCRQEVKPIPTDEDKPLFPTSVYAVSKRDQEEMFISVGRAYNIPAVALRYFNVYGPRQSLSNPYTGVAAIFSGRILNGLNPIVFEDGLQGRDFTHVSDIVQANILAMEKREADYEVFNVGTGRSTNLQQLLDILLKELDKEGKITPEIVNKFREGDIRHCYGDITRIKKTLGYEPRVKFEQGFLELIRWVKSQTAVDSYEVARNELESRSLIK